MSSQSLPTGTVTYLMTDVEGSTRLWDLSPDKMHTALQRHDLLAQESAAAFAGQILKARGEGDSLFFVFYRVQDAISAAIAFFTALDCEPGDFKLRVRGAIHTGSATIRDEDYYGQPVNRCARLRSIAAGGQILVSEAAAQLAKEVMPEYVTLKNLGSHRLKDLSAPAQVFELQHPLLPKVEGELVSLTGLDQNLPVQLTTFVGRRTELSGIQRALREQRLVTLIGAGGTGKTRLVLQAAAESSDIFQSIRFIDLQPLSSGIDLIAQIGKEVGLGEPETDSVSKLEFFFRDKRSLLLLDNCEHVIEEVASGVLILLSRCPTVTVLATSREPLKLPSEARIPLPPMRVPSAVASAEEVAANDACTLFIERARLRRQDLSLTPENAEHIRNLCILLEGIPLAIEQAASHASALSPKQMVMHFRKRLENLKTDDRSVPKRHRTLKAAIDWSYGTLSRQEQEFFVRISVLAGSWTLEAAQGICAYGDLEDCYAPLVLERLIDLSFAQVEERGDEVRYRMLQVMREYAQPLLADERELRTRHAEYYIGLARDVMQAHEPRPFDLDYDNFIQGLNWLAKHDPTRSLEAIVELRTFMVRRGSLSQNYALVTKTLQNDTLHASPELARACNLAGAIAYRMIDPAASQFWCERSLFLWRELGMDAETAAPLHNLALVAGSLGDSDEAWRLLNEIRGAYRRLADTAKEGIATLNMGRFQLDKCETTEARKLLRDALPLLQDGKNESSYYLAKYNLSVLSLLEDDLEAAITHLRDCFTFWKQSGEGEVCTSLCMLAIIATRCGDSHSAAALLEFAKHLYAIDQHGLAQLETRLLAESRLCLTKSEAQGDYALLVGASIEEALRVIKPLLVRIAEARKLVDSTTTG